MSRHRHLGVLVGMFLVGMVWASPANAADDTPLPPSEPVPCWCPEPDSPQSGRLWARAEYLLWWVNGDKLPPLVTTSPAGTPQALAGVLGPASTTVLFGDEGTNSEGRSGGRFTLGGWFECEHILGVEANFFLLEPRSTGFATQPGDVPILARPFTDVTIGQPIAHLVSFPGVASGRITVADEASNLLGAGLLGRARLFSDCSGRVDAIAGYRFLYYKESLDVTEESTRSGADDIPRSFPAGTNLASTDHFGTQNTFHGFDVGFCGEYHYGRWSLEGLTKLAVGCTDSSRDVEGSTTVIVPGFPPRTRAAGLLALSSNSGHFDHQQLGLVPEFGLRLGCDLTSRLRASAGYTLLWWNRIERPQDALDLNVNSNLLPPIVPGGGPALPAPLSRTSSLFIQGIDLGLEFRF
jgi:hypothetical protein